MRSEEKTVNSERGRKNVNVGGRRKKVNAERGGEEEKT